MKILSVLSDRIIYNDLDGDGQPELTYGKLSTILVVDPETNRVKMKIKIKPKIEKKIREKEISNLRSIVSEDALIEKPSLAGEFILKMKLSDINNDGIPELIYLRTDGILGAVSLRGKNLWSHYLGPIGDFIPFEDKHIKIIAIKDYDTLCFLDAKGKMREQKISTNSRNRFIKTLGDDIFLAAPEGVITKISLKRDSNKGPYAPQVTKQAAYLKFGRLNTISTIGEPYNYIALGFDDGTVILLDRDLNELNSFNLGDSIIGLFSLADLGKIFIASWMGKNAIIDLEGSKITEYSFSRRLNLDIDNDNNPEEIKVVTKSLQVIRNSNKIFEVTGRSYITAFVVDDIDNDSQYEILVSWRSGTFSIYRFPESRSIYYSKLPFIPRGIITTDLENDGKKEIILLGEDSMIVGRF